jgi:hypothetical protein
MLMKNETSVGADARRKGGGSSLVQSVVGNVDGSELSSLWSP